MPSRVTTRRTGFNIATMWARNLVSMGVGLFLVAFVVGRVGAEHYGGWTAVASLIGYLGLLDAGMSVALQHFVAGHAARDERKDLLAVFNSAMLLYGVVALATLGLLLVLAAVYPAAFPKIPDDAAAECSVALRWVAFGMMGYLLNLPIQGSLLGLQRHYARNASEIVSVLTRAATVVIAFAVSGPSLAHLGMAFFAATCARFVVSAALLRWLEPAVRLRPTAASWEAVRRLVGYGGHSFIWASCFVVIRNSGPLFATALLGPAEATFLYVGTRLTEAFAGMIRSAGAVFVSVASSLQASGEEERLRKTAIFGTRFAALVGFSGAVLLIVFGMPAIEQWVGPGYESAYQVTVIVAAGMALPWAFNVALNMLMGMRILWPMTRVMLAQTALFLALATALGIRFELHGLAVAMVLPAALVNVLWVPPTICARAGLRVRDLLVGALPRPIAVAAAVGLASWGLTSLWPPTELAVVLVECAIAGSLFAALAAGWGLDPAMRRQLWARMTRRREAPAAD